MTYSQKLIRLRYFSLSCATALLFLIAGGITAQTSGTITGEVKDTNSALVVGVQITARQIETGVTRTTLSEAEGRFIFPGLPVGTYEIHTEHQGFEPLVHPPVRLTVNDTVEVSLSIGIAIYPVQSEEYAELIRRADQEMYRDKASRPVAFSTGDREPRSRAVAVTCASMPR